MVCREIVLWRKEPNALFGAELHCRVGQRLRYIAIGVKKILITLSKVVLFVRLSYENGTNFTIQILPRAC